MHKKFFFHRIIRLSPINISFLLKISPKQIVFFIFKFLLGFLENKKYNIHHFIKDSIIQKIVKDFAKFHFYSKNLLIFIHFTNYFFLLDFHFFLDLYFNLNKLMKN